MHPWDLTVEEAQMLQESLAGDCVLEGDPDVETLAAVDISMYPDSRIGIASATLYSLSRESILEETVLLGDLTFPYVSGLLAFREAPLMLEAIMHLDRQPDCLLVDGHGYAHPRRFGLASHLGLLLELPSVGCAKSILVGEYDEPGKTVGNYSDIWDGEPVGYALRSHPQGDPIFLSPGHLISRENVLPLIRSLLDGRSKLPLPLHRAHKSAHRQRQTLNRLTSPFVEQDIGIFLVGGAIRDLLIGSAPRDYDLVATAFPEVVRNTLEDHAEARFFTLDEQRDVHRLVGDDLQIDVTVVAEDTVVEDLLRRDFTINSIGLDMNRESWVDPANGREDIRDEVLRPSGENSLVEDPLRILRAYRLAQSYGLHFAEELNESIHECATRLSSVSRERVVDELLLLVHGPNPASTLQSMKSDGLLERVDFLREEGVRDLQWVQDHRTVLEGHRLLEGKYHGGYTLLDGFVTCRLIDPDHLDGWPFHRAILSTTRASYEPLPREPEFDVLTSSHRRLLGRILGEGLRQGWSREHTGEMVSRLGHYVSRRDQLEKEIVQELGDADRIGERKREQLREELPELWNTTMETTD